MTIIYDNDNYYVAAVDKDKSRFPGGHLDKLEQLGVKFDNKCDRCVVRGAIFSSWCLEGTYDDD